MSTDARSTATHRTTSTITTCDPFRARYLAVALTLAVTDTLADLAERDDTADLAEMVAAYAVLADLAAR